MRETIRRVLREKLLKEQFGWSSLDEAVPVPEGQVKKYILHSTTVDPRVLYNEGIKPMGVEDSKEWKGNYPPVIFAMNGICTIWAQGLTKGAVVIDTTLIPNHKWWYDPYFYNEKNDCEGKIAIITNERIPAEAIKGILCNRDLGNLRFGGRRNMNDNETQQYLDEVMRENAEEWSNDCEAKMDDIYRKEGLI